MNDKIYTAAQMREREQQAVARGTTFLQLMENAGQSAAHDILRRYPAPEHALIVCGKGNNGGDGLVIARVLAEQGWQVDVMLAMGEKLSELAETNRKRLTFPLRQTKELAEILSASPALIIDAIFGTGFGGALPDTVAHLCRQINNADGVKIALDLPSGLNSDTGDADADTFRADLTYAFAARKPAHVLAPAWCGEIVCLDIGID